MNSENRPQPEFLRGPVPLSHLILQHVVRQGDYAVDATCGNGNDTLLLAQLVGLAGRVWAFDIQQDALDITGQKLTEAGVHEQVNLVLAGHESMKSHLDHPVAAVTFNLGYLPGGNRSITTRPNTTGAALAQSLELVKIGGIITITVYPGHTVGKREQVMVDDWAAALDQRHFHVWRMGQVNVAPHAPYLSVIQKAR